MHAVSDVLVRLNESKLSQSAVCYGLLCLWHANASFETGKRSVPNQFLLFASASTIGAFWDLAAVVPDMMLRSAEDNLDRRAARNMLHRQASTDILLRQAESAGCLLHHHYPSLPFTHHQ